MAEPAAWRANCGRDDAVSSSTDFPSKGLLAQCCGYFVMDWCSAVACARALVMASSAEMGFTSSWSHTSRTNCPNASRSRGASMAQYLRNTELGSGLFCFTACTRNNFTTSIGTG